MSSMSKEYCLKTPKRVNVMYNRAKFNANQTKDIKKTLKQILNFL